MVRIERDKAASSGPALPAHLVAAQSLLQGQGISNPEERLKLERFVVAFLTTGGTPPTASEASQIRQDVAVLVTSKDPQERRAVGLIAEREEREGFALLLSEARAAQATTEVELGERFARVGRLAFFRDVGAAIEAFEAAVRLNPKDVDSRVRLARLLGRANRTGEAREHLESAVSLADKLLDKAEARARLAEHLFWNGDVGQAADAAERAVVQARTLITQDPAGREQLALAMTFAGRIALKQGDSAAAVAHMRAAVNEARQLCAANEGAAGRLRLSDALARASEPIRNAEGLEAATRLSTEAVEIARGVAAGADAPPEAARTLAVALWYAGSLAEGAGDRATAEARFTEALKLGQARAAADPKDGEAQRDVSLNLTKLGDLAQSAGDRATAEARYSEALKIDQARAAADPKDSQARRDVSVNLTRLGDLAGSAGDRATAEARFTEALKIGQARAAADPKDSEARRDVSLNLTRLGDLAGSAGDRATAEARFTEALKIDQARAAADPKDSVAQRDVSVNLTKLGDLAKSADDRATAGARYTEALKIDQARAAADPKDSQAQRDVSLNLTNLGDLAKGAGDRATAEARFAEALKIDQARAAADPKDSVAQQDLRVSLSRVRNLARAS